MTPEEAVEVVLAGKPWDMCPKCLGLCFQYKMDDDNMQVDDPQLCIECKGTGCQLRPIYRKACKTLRRRPPKARLGQWDLMQQTIERMRMNGVRVDQTVLDDLLRATREEPEPESSPFR